MANALELLADDHRKVEDLFDEFEQSGDESTASQICDELTVHTQVEESIVYPELQRLDADLEQEAEHEHSEARQLIERIRTASGDDLVDLVGQLREAIDHHVSEEETKAFPELATLGAVRLYELGEAIMDAKVRASAA
jgi:hemerythrin superfamily protein